MRCSLQFLLNRFYTTLLLFFLSFVLHSNVLSQPANPSSSGSKRRISFAEAQKLLAGETEGNLTKKAGVFTRTKLSDGRVLELFYPISSPNPMRRSRPIVSPGYGEIFESEAALNAAAAPRHMLDDLIPDGALFIENVPEIITRLEKRVGKLNYTRESLRKLDSLIAGFHSRHTTAQTDPKLFQELSAYYGETLRRTLNGEWRVCEEKIGKTGVYKTPNVVVTVAGKSREIKPWSSVIIALYDEEKRGLRLTRVFDDDLAEAR
jgi:hypothetical protein